MNQAQFDKLYDLLDNLSNDSDFITWLEENTQFDENDFNMMKDHIVDYQRSIDNG